MGLSPGKGHQGGARNSRNLQANKTGHYKNLGDDGEYQMETNICLKMITEFSKNFGVHDC